MTFPVDFPEYPSLPDERARQFLAFAAAHPVLIRAEEAIRRELGLTPARYVQLLHRLIDTQQALDIDPVLTHRLRRIRDEQHAELTRRRGGAAGLTTRHT